MGKKMLMLLGLVVMASGCATTAQDQTMVTQLQMRVGELEQEIQAKDARIDEIEYEVKDLSYDVKRMKDQSKPVGAIRTSSSSSSSSAAVQDGEIIRVPVSAEQVQGALKAAGYYSGAVDGKIGSGTKQAIVQFQKDNSLTADGLIGKQTWEALKAYAQ